MPPTSPDERQIRADAALMASAAAGDARSFEILMRRESARLAGLGISLLGDPGEAEDVVQDAFVRLWQAAPDWQPHAQVGTWLYRVVYRLAIDRLRRRRPGVDVDAMHDTLADGNATPEDDLADRQRADLVERALGLLAPRQRAAVLLAHRDGLSQARAAEVMEIGEEAYESLLARGRRRLKQIVAGAEMDGPASEGLKR